MPSSSSWPPRLDERQLDRARPLWELWFLTGLRDGRVGVLLKLHHCVADGLAAVALMGSLFDVESDDGDPDPIPWIPEPIPGGWSLLIDNLAHKARTALQAAAMLAHPRRLVRGAWCPGQRAFGKRSVARRPAYLAEPTRPVWAPSSFPSAGPVGREAGWRAPTTERSTTSCSTCGPEGFGSC